MSSNLESFVTFSRPPPKPVSQSAIIQDQDSTFSASLFRAVTVNEVRRSVEHTRKVVHASSPASHEINAWRCMALKSGRDGLAGPEDFELISGADDDGEKYGGARILRVMEAEGIVDAVVVCSRWFGGTMLGPIRFTHIETCVREVCRNYKVIEEVEDIIAELRELDSTLADLRSKLAESTGSSKPPTGKVPDYSTLVEPPDVAKARRLLNARRSTVEWAREKISKDLKQ